MDHFKTTDEWYIEWYNEWLRVTTNDNECKQMTTSDNEWYNERQRMRTSDNKSSFWLIFFYRIREKPTSMHPKLTLYTLRMIMKRDYWIKSKNKPLRRNINGKKQESRQFFVCDTSNFKNFWRKYDTNST